MEKLSYTLFFKKDIKKLYAYTDDKKLAKRFREIRVESLFFEKAVYLDVDEIRELHEECSECRLVLYDFDYKGIEFPITELEKLQVEHLAIQSILNLGLLMYPPELFTQEVQSALANVSYTKIYNYYRKKNNITICDIIKPNYFLYFIYLFGDTLKVVKMNESLDVLFE